MRCSCAKYWFLVGGILFGIAAIIVVIFGYVIPMIKSSDYTLQSCKVVATQITDNAPYDGIATLNYLSLTDPVTVVTSTVRSYVQSYLGANYRVGTNVQCLVSADDIRVSIFISQIGLVFTIILAILCAVCLVIFIVICLIHRSKRGNYVDLDAVDRRPM